MLSPEKPYQSWLYYLHEADPRRGAFLLAALAAWFRGTTTLFSYDFTSGVALCAGLLAFVGAFTRRSLLLLLLTSCGAEVCR